MWFYRKGIHIVMSSERQLGHKQPQNKTSYVGFTSEMVEVQLIGNRVTWFSRSVCHRKKCSFETEKAGVPRLLKSCNYYVNQVSTIFIVWSFRLFPVACTKMRENSKRRLNSRSWYCDGFLIYFLTTLHRKTLGPLKRCQVTVWVWNVRPFQKPRWLIVCQSFPNESLHKNMPVTFSSITRIITCRGLRLLRLLC